MEQALAAGEPVDDRRLLAVEAELVGEQRDGEAAEVADVLADGQRAVDVVAGQLAGLEAVVLGDELVGADL